MNLGLAPLAGVESDGVASRVLRAVRDFGGAAFNFEGLQEFKAKWRPRWEARYIAYERDVDLPRIAVAITALASSSRKKKNRLVGVAQRYPFSLTMIGLTLWFSIATNLDPGFEHVLRYRFGLSYRDLVHLEWWRVVTFPIIEPRAGFVWVNLALIVLAFPAAERRLGTWRTAVTFFVGGFVASVPVLLVLRLVGALGNQRAPCERARPRCGSFGGMLGTCRRAGVHNRVAALAPDRGDGGIHSSGRGIRGHARSPQRPAPCGDLGGGAARLVVVTADSEAAGRGRRRCSRCGIPRATNRPNPGRD